MTYDKPNITDHGSLRDLTAMMNVGGPVDTYAAHPPGHSCPTGPPGPNEHAGGGVNNGDPQCVGNGGGVGGGNDFPGNPDFNPNNPGHGGTPPGQGNGPQGLGNSPQGLGNGPKG
jgi:hypothetical protein